MSDVVESNLGISEEIDPALADLIDQLTARIQAGEAIDLEACLREHPHFASQLRELLPAALAFRAAGRMRWPRLGRCRRRWSQPR